MNRISDLTRRLWAALLALCLVLALTLPVFAEGESETADTAEKETFHIGTVDDLLQLADSCRLDSWSKNRTVYLDADLELTGSGFAGIPSFSGVFEGQGHTISGLSLVDDGSVIGFFRYVQQGQRPRHRHPGPLAAHRQPLHRGRHCGQQRRYAAQLPL